MFDLMHICSACRLLSGHATAQHWLDSSSVMLNVMHRIPGHNTQHCVTCDITSDLHPGDATAGVGEMCA